MQNSKGSLYLLPNLLDEELSYELFLPAKLPEIVQSLQGLIVESEKSARRYLRRFVSHDVLVKFPLKLLNEHTQKGDVKELLAPLEAGENWGLISDAGLPCLADPGSDLVILAQERGLKIIPIAGPSSIIFALQSSGLSGQRFAFHGYLPREPEDLKKALIKLERRAREDQATQIFIEAPYRSAKIAAHALETLQPSTRFCIALNLTSPSERLLTRTIAAWRKSPWEIGKEPAVFLLL
jgi:16S rRNA (cytidine1402-2'-O)-methyltransferase